MTKTIHGHQGDVLLVFRGDTKPKGVPVAEGRIILALGEVTGHSHVIEQEGCAEFIVDGSRMVWVVAPTTIHHEEHDFELAMGVADVLTPGAWEVVQQWDEWAKRRVAD